MVAQPKSWTNSMMGKRVQYPSLQEPVNTPVQAQDFFVSSWHRPLSEPVRTKKPLSIGTIPFLELDPFPIALPLDVSNFRWWMQPSEPVRDQKPLPIGIYPSHWIDRAPTVPRIKAWTEGDISASEPLTLTKPSGVQAGDLLLLLCMSGEQTVPPVRWQNDKAGWKNQGESGDSNHGIRNAFYWRVADGTEGATEDIGYAQPGNLMGFYVCVSGAHQESPIHAYQETLSASSGTHTLAGVTTTVDNCLILYSHGFDGGTGLPFTVVDEPPWTQSDEHQSGVGATDASGDFGSRSLPVAGDSGSLQITNSVSDGGASWQIAIQPADSEFVTPDKWKRPLSEPVRTKKPLAIGSIPSLELDPFPRPPPVGIDLLRWLRPLSEPVRENDESHASRIPSWWIDRLQLTLPERTQLDKWYSPLSEPVRESKPLPIGSYPHWWMDPVAKLELEILRWFAPLSEPVREIPIVPAALMPFWVMDADIAAVPPEIITMDKWFRELSEPVRVKTPLNTALQYWEIDRLQLTLPERTQLDKWYSPLSEPVRSKKPLPLGAIPSWEFDPFPLPFIPGLDLFRWYRPPSEPVRERDKVHAARVPAWWIDRLQLTLPERTQLDKWYSPLSEPVRTQKPLPIGVAPFYWMDQIAKLEPDRLRWFAPLSEPVRVGKPLPIGAYPFLAFSRFLIIPLETTSMDKWHRPLSEPVRTKKPLPIGAYPANWDDADLLTRPEETLISKWYSPLSVPSGIYVQKRSEAALISSGYYFQSPPIFITVGQICGEFVLLSAVDGSHSLLVAVDGSFDLGDC